MAEQRGAAFIRCTRYMGLPSIFAGAPAPLADPTSRAISAGNAWCRMGRMLPRCTLSRVVDLVGAAAVAARERLRIVGLALKENHSGCHHGRSAQGYPYMLQSHT